MKSFKFLMKHIIKHPVKLCTLMRTRCIWWRMAEHMTSSKTLVSLRRTNVGHLKKFTQPWNNVMKRIYITAGNYMKFCQLKKANGFPSDDCTFQHLLNFNEGTCLQLSTVYNQHVYNLLSLGTPVMCSTPSRTPAISTRYDIQRCYV